MKLMNQWLRKGVVMAMAILCGVSLFAAENQGAKNSSGKPVAGSNDWKKEGKEYVSSLPSLPIPSDPVFSVGPAGQYKDIASAIAALPATGGTVRIASGIYEIQEAIRIPSNVALIGEGASTRIQMKPEILAHILTNANHDKGNQNILIRGLVLAGNLNSGGKPPQPGNLVAGNDNCRGIYFNRVTDAQVLDCFITETGTNPFLAEKSQNIVFAHNEEKFCFHCLNFTLCKNVTVAYNSAIQKWSGEAPYFNSTHHSRVFKNYIERMGMDGMAFDFNSSYNEIHDNLVIGSNLNGILLNRNAHHNTVHNNVIKNNGAYRNNPFDRMDGIHLASGASNNTISNNVCMDDQSNPTQRYGIYIRDATCRDNIISGNKFSGNTAGEIKDLKTNTKAQEPKTVK